MLGVVEAPLKPAGGGVARSRRKSRAVDFASIEQLDRVDCIERWRQLFGVMPPKYTSLEFMHKALCYEAQVKAFSGHSNAVQRALKASSKPVQREAETGRSVDVNVNVHEPTASASCARPEGVIERLAPDAGQTFRHNSSAAGACDQFSITSCDGTKPDGVTQTQREATNILPKPARPPKPSVLSIRAGTHLVREWNGRTYQVEALDKGFKLDGKTYRSLSAIAKKITGSHWSGPRFFGLES